MKLLTSLGKATTLLTLSVAIFASCEKQISNSADRSGTNQQKDAQFAIAQAVINGDEWNTAYNGSTNTVAAGNVSIKVSQYCGKSALERGYVLNEAGEKMYNGVGCSTAGVMWEEGSYNCDPAGFTANHTLAAGTYAFRIKTNPVVGNNDPCGGKAKCEGIKGVQTVCFSIVAQ